MIYIIYALAFVVSVYVFVKRIKRGDALLGKCERRENIIVVDGSTASLYRCVFSVSYADKSKNIQIDCLWRPRKGKKYSIIYDEKSNKYVLKNDYLMFFILLQLVIIIMLIISLLKNALLGR